MTMWTRLVWIAPVVSALLIGQETKEFASWEDRFAMLMRVQDSMSRYLEREKRKDAALAAATETQHLAPFKISRLDLTIISPIARQLREDLDAINAELIGLRDSIPSGLTEEKAAEFQSRRLQTIRSAADRLKASISSGAWKGLEDFLTAEAARSQAK